MSRYAALAALAALLLPLTARAGANARFGVGATVVASATVSVLRSDARTGLIQIRASTHHTPTPMLLVGRAVLPMQDGNSSVASGQSSTVTVLY